MTQTVVDAGSAEAAARGSTSGVAVLDRETGVYSDNGTNAHTQFTGASLVKLFIADSVLRRARLGEISLSQADRDSIVPMLRSSDNGPANRLWSRYGGNGIVQDVIGRYGLGETSPTINVRYWGLVQITARDMTAYYNGMLSGAGGLAAADRDFIVSQLRQSTALGSDGEPQWWGLHDGLQRESVIGIKQGWTCCFSDGYIWRHSSGIVGPDARYVVVVLTRDAGGLGSDHTEATSTRVVQRMFPAGLIPRVRGAIGDRWYAAGGNASPIGLPLGPEGLATGGAWQQFERGRVYWSPATGAELVRGGILESWIGQGSENGPLRFPTNSEGPATGGAWQAFETGRVYWSPATGAHWVRGAIASTWADLGRENGVLGYPVTDEGVATAGAWQEFQRGRVYWSAATGAQPVRGGILASWLSQGAENGPLRYPLEGERDSMGGAWQAFQGGRVSWSPNTGAHWLDGALLQAWIDSGAETGPLGYPTSEPRPVGSGGRRVDFERGSLLQDARGDVTTTGAARVASGQTPSPSTSEGTAPAPSRPDGSPAPTTAPVDPASPPSSAAPLVPRNTDGGDPP